MVARIMDEDDLLPCWHCDEDVEIDPGWAALGAEYTCPHCGRVNVVADNYISIGHHLFHMEPPEK
jgi:predicted RNA-binding Zn-ribbon protein involved in translation (DUF1610 family)